MQLCVYRFRQLIYWKITHLLGFSYSFRKKVSIEACESHVHHTINNIPRKLFVTQYNLSHFIFSIGFPPTIMTSSLDCLPISSVNDQMLQNDPAFSFVCGNEVRSYTSMWHFLYLGFVFGVKKDILQCH